MSGGGSGEEPAGIMEASPGALAVIITFFLLFTIGFERLLHAARHALARRKKLGLLAALNNIASEIMLLGLASLLLVAFEAPITRVCLPSATLHMTPWLEWVDDCSCCLAPSRTEDVSPCFMQWKFRTCDANFTQECTSDERAFFKGLHHKSQVLSAKPRAAAANATHAATSSSHARRRRLAAAPLGAAAGEAASQQCQADAPYKVSYSECGNRAGYVPMITSTTLEQVHMLLFIMAVTHIVVSMLVLLVSSLKLQLWAACGGGAAEDALAVAAAAAAAAAPPSPAAALGSPFAKHASRAAVDATVPDVGAAREQSAVVVVQQDVAGEELAVPKWRGRPEHLARRPLAYARELLELVVRQILLLHPTVTRQEYSLLRACFYYTHTRPAGAPADGKAAAAAGGTAAPGAPLAAGTFGPYLTELLERDGSRVVGLGIPMWVLVIAFVLLSSRIGWATWLYLVLGGALLLVVNCLLLLSLRMMTRGGVVRPAAVQGAGWLHRLAHSSFLLHCIKLLLFLFSFVISNAIFFAVFFGPTSCFFSRTGFQRNPIPWWGIQLIDIMLLLNLALVTLPLYSVTRHTLQVDGHLLEQVALERRARNAAAAAAAGKGAASNGASASSAAPAAASAPAAVAAAAEEEELQMQQAASV